MSHQVFISNGLKYKKVNKQVKRVRGVASNNFLVGSESFILKNISGFQYTPNQLESSRRVLRRQLNRDVSLKAFICCDLPKTAKSSGVRMGKGKGNTDRWVAACPRGKILFTLDNTSYYQSLNACSKALKKYASKKKFYLNRYLDQRVFGKVFDK